MPIELGDSWFSPKCIEVQPQVLVSGGRALDGLGGETLANSNQTLVEGLWKEPPQTVTVR